MKGKVKEDRQGQVLGTVLSFVTLFALICFAVTISMTLFLRVMIHTMGLEFQRAEIRQAALLTFFNVLFLSLLCAAVDFFRRRLMVERPVRRLIAAAEKVMEGDFSVRVEKGRGLIPNSGLDMITDYFNRMAEELSGTEILQTDFIANVSHELKTPLAVMQNYGAMLQQPDLPEGQRIEYAKAITDASRNLSSMVANILKLNKLENQNIYPAVQTYDLGEQLCQVLLGFEEVWERKGIELSTEIAENVRISADPELLMLVWNNLFSNAFKFTQPGGKVTLELERAEGAAVVKISDTGCGFGPEIGAHIFEKFYQGDTSHAAKGNGLGLALVKRVIEITGGDISVSSQVGRGSTFTVKLRRERDGAS